MNFILRFRSETFANLDIFAKLAILATQSLQNINKFLAMLLFKRSSFILGWVGLVYTFTILNLS